MATVTLSPRTVVDDGIPEAITVAGGVVLSAAQAVANGAGPEASTNVAYRGNNYNGGAVVIANTGGATPTIKVDIQGSMDGSVWYNVPYALVATPRTFVLTQLTITTTATTTYLLQELVPYQYIRLNYSTTTNETMTATVYF